MARIALYTFGVLKGRYDSDEMTEFYKAAPSVYASLGSAEGFIAQAGDSRPGPRRQPAVGDDYGAWGVLDIPRFFDRFDPAVCSPIQTLSLWHDWRSAKAFSYGALHRTYLVRRAEWFQPADWPGYVLWWVGDDQIPQWCEGAERLDGLADKGPTTSGFNFARIFDEAGRPQS